MATTFSSTTLLALALFTLLTSAAHGTLSPSFYNASCPKLQTVVRAAMVDVVRKEPRMAASILRLFFHDCFPNVRLPCLNSLFFFFHCDNTLKDILKLILST